MFSARASSALALSILPLSMSRAADLIAAGYVAIGRLSVSITISLARLATMGRAFCTSPSPNNSRDNLTAFFTDSTLAWISWVMTRTSTGAKASLASRANTSSSFPLASSSAASASLVFFASRRIKASWVLASAVIASWASSARFLAASRAALSSTCGCAALDAAEGAAAPGLEPAADWARAGPLSPTTTARASAEKVYCGCLIFMILGS